MGHTAPLTCDIASMINLPHGLRVPIDVATSPDYSANLAKGTKAIQKRFIGPLNMGVTLILATSAASAAAVP